MDYKLLGLNLIENFITPLEETEILNNIEKKEHSSRFSRNSIRRYGKEIPYRDNQVAEYIPEHIDKVCDRLLNEGFVKRKPSSVTINEYCKSQSITPHIDNKACGETISILSLMNQATMVFSKGEESFSVELMPRSLVQMTNEIRNEWKHSIEPVNAERYSIVFRCSD